MVTSMVTICNATLNTCWDTATYQFFRKRFDQRWLQFLLAYSFSNWLAVSYFSFWKALSVFVCKRHFWWRQIWRHLHVSMLQCGAKFSNVLVQWSIRMIRAKNYETVPKFVKVMARILWPLFFSRTWCITRVIKYSICYYSS